MTDRKKKNELRTVQKDYHCRDRWFTIAKVLLTISPLLSLGFLQSASVGAGQDMQTILSENPQITVSFLASMTGPFIAYLLGFVQKHLYEGDGRYASANLSLMFVAEAMLRNAFYLVMMGVLLYFVFDLTGISPVQAFRQKWGKTFLGDISGSLVLIIFCAFCMFVSMRIGMV